LNLNHFRNKAQLARTLQVALARHLLNLSSNRAHGRKNDDGTGRRDTVWEVAR